MKHRKSAWKKPAVTIFVVVCLMAVLSGLAVAANLFGVGDLMLPEDAQPENMALISLQGVTGSPEFEAAAAWRAFTDAYDPDHALLSQLGNDMPDLALRYVACGAYTQEMADRLDEITREYGLELHGDMTVLGDAQAVRQAVGAGLLGDGHTPYSGYVYPDGTFQFDGAWSGGEDLTVDYQLRRHVRGYFDAVVLNIGDVSQYSQRTLTTETGDTVVLASGADKSLIVAERPESMVVVNVLAGSGTLTEDALVRLAASFDFSTLA